MKFSRNFHKNVLFVALLALFCIGLSNAENSDDKTYQQNNSLIKFNQFGPGNNVPDKVVHAANSGLEPFLESIPKSDLEHYGFNNISDFDIAILGLPYKVMTISPDRLSGNTNNKNIWSILTSTHMWLFPILVDNDVRAILTVDYYNNNWEAVAIGSSGFAKQLSQMEQAWPDEQGYSRVLVKIFQAKSDLLLLTKDNSVNVALFKSAEIALNRSISDESSFALYNTSEIFPEFSRIVQENIEQNNR